MFFKLLEARSPKGIVEECLKYDNKILQFSFQIILDPILLLTSSSSATLLMIF